MTLVLALGATEEKRTWRRSETESTIASRDMFEMDSLQHQQLSANSTDVQEAPLPTLIGRRLAQLPVLSLKVKNTFIDDFEDSDQDFGGFVMRRMQTWHASPSPCSPVSSPVHRVIAVNVQLQAERSQDQIQPLETRRAQASIGSSGHDSGICRPCAWFWSTEGCANGVDCRHCHRCEPGEVKRRRKVNRRLARALQSKGSRDSKSTGSDDSSPASN